MRPLTPFLTPFLAALLLLIATPARATPDVWDGFNRPDADKLGHADTGQRWRPMKLGPEETWAIRGDRAAFLPGTLNDYVRYTRIASSSTSPSTMRIDADVTFSPVSANVGVAVNLARSDHVFCKAERTASNRQPYGFLAIGGQFDGAAELSVLGNADYTFTKADQLTLATTYHLALVRSGRSVTCSISGTNSLGVAISRTVSETLRPSQANGLNSTYAGLRFRYVVGDGTSNEDDGGSRWDNVVVSDAA